MKEQFVTYEIALQLKELKFKLTREKSFGRFTTKGELVQMPFLVAERTIVAPLWQQAIDWLREKYSLAIGYTVAYPLSYSFHVQDLIRTTNRRNWNFNGGIEYVDDFKQGQEQAILKAIELIKQA